MLEVYLWWSVSDINFSLVFKKSTLFLVQHFGRQTIDKQNNIQYQNKKYLL